MLSASFTATVMQVAPATRHGSSLGTMFLDMNPAAEWSALDSASLYWQNFVLRFDFASRPLMVDCQNLQDFCRNLHLQSIEVVHSHS